MERSVSTVTRGSSLALVAMLGPDFEKPASSRIGLVLLGLFGAALIFADEAIIPAISALSAIEGLELVSPAFKAYVIPRAFAVLFGLYAIHRFGPVMLLWTLFLGLIGLLAIIDHPSVL